MFTRINYNSKIIYSSFVLICSGWLVIAQSSIKLCRKVYGPEIIDIPKDCTTTCSPKLLNFDISTEIDEFILCKDNHTFFPCNGHNDCRRYHGGATCKKVFCLCQGYGNHAYGNHVIYPPDSHVQIPHIYTCTVSNKWLNPELPLVPFPWKTLLVVFAIVASFAMCLIAVRWISPFIRAMQAKSAARNHQNRRNRRDGECANFLPTISLAEMPRIRPCTRYADRIFLPTTSRNSNLSIDKPPPYEIAVQGPPSYTEVEQEPLNSTQRTSENSEHEPNVSRLTQCTLIHSSSNVSITTI